MFHKLIELIISFLLFIHFKRWRKVDEHQAMKNYILNAVKGSYPSVSSAVHDLTTSINEGQTVIFCGAGISYASGLPTVNPFIQYLLEKLEVPSIQRKKILGPHLDNLGLPFEAFMECLTNYTDCSQLFNIYKAGKPNTNHLFLAKLMKAGKIKIIVTTNFDTLIEDALRDEGWEEGIDYQVVYNEEDFLKIYWDDGKPRLIKIHGSIEEPERIVITLQQVGSHVLSAPRMRVIEHVFSSGVHKSVLFLGYSSSDVFDLCAQIEAVRGKRKEIFYIQHTSNRKVEGVWAKETKNPFKKYSGPRLYYPTNKLIKEMWESLVPKEPYTRQTSDTRWRKNVDEWHRQLSGSYRQYSILEKIFVYLSEHSLALEYSMRAIQIARKMEDKAKEAECLARIGATYGALKNYHAALDFSNRALQIAREVGNKHIENICLCNLGPVYTNLGNLREASKCLEQGLLIARGNEDEELESGCLGNLGEIQYKRGNYPEAIKYLEKAVQISRMIGTKMDEAKLLSNLGDIYYHVGNPAKSIEFSRQAIRIAQEIGDREGQDIGLRRLEEINQKIGILPKKSMTPLSLSETKR